MEDYPSPAEGNGLENRQACKSVRGFESHILLLFIYINYFWLGSSIGRVRSTASILRMGFVLANVLNCSTST